MNRRHIARLPLFPHFCGVRWRSFRYTFLSSPWVTDVCTIIIHVLRSARFRFSGYDFTWLLTIACSDTPLPAGVSTHNAPVLIYLISVSSVWHRNSTSEFDELVIMSFSTCWRFSYLITQCTAFFICLSSWYHYSL